MSNLLCTRMHLSRGNSQHELIPFSCDIKYFQRRQKDRPC